MIYLCQGHLPRRLTGIRCSSPCGDRKLTSIVSTLVSFVLHCSPFGLACSRKKVSGRVRRTVSPPRPYMHPSLRLCTRVFYFALFRVSVSFKKGTQISWGLRSRRSQFYLHTLAFSIKSVLYSQHAQSKRVVQLICRCRLRSSGGSMSTATLFLFSPYPTTVGKWAFLIHNIMNGRFYSLDVARRTVLPLNVASQVRTKKGRAPNEPHELRPFSRCASRMA